MAYDDGVSWERIEQQALRTVAARMLSGQEIDPERAARDVLAGTLLVGSEEQVSRLERFIQRELPAITLKVAELQRGRGKSGR